MGLFCQEKGIDINDNLIESWTKWALSSVSSLGDNVEQVDIRNKKRCR